jgi:hypothetical protein
MHRDDTAFDGGPSAKRHDWQCMPGADADDFSDFFGAVGKRHRVWRMRSVGRFIAAVFFADDRIDGQPIA